MRVLAIAAIISVPFGLAIHPAVGQTTWHVDDDATNDPGAGDPSISDPLENGSPDHPFDAIQEAVVASNSGDVVLVADGTYTGSGNRDIDFGGRLINVRSRNGARTCIIDCRGSDSDRHRGFWFHHDETAASVLDGFTITGGWQLWGGGIQVFDGSNPTIRNCRIIANHAEHGGGIYVDRDCSPSIRHCVFQSNQASGNGGGMYSANGSHPLVINCLFFGNGATDDGGGMYNWFISSPTIINSTFVGNYAGQGGGIHNLQLGSPTLINCVLDGNTAIHGAAMNTNEGSPRFINCTITGNTASVSAGGMRNYSNSHPQLHNCIVWGNSGEQIVDFDGAQTTASFSDIQGGWTGNGNIDVNPLFANPLGPDGIAGTLDDDLRLGVGSPCIDAGDSTSLPIDTFDIDNDSDVMEVLPLDFEGGPRIMLCEVDIGADEFTGGEPSSGDMDGNGMTKLADLPAFVSALLDSTDGCIADLNGDGAVDGLDIAALVQVLLP